ncbi:hypothetical protein [Undibacterium sp.]|uniref:hypothetical protein n=1 Tax=Undibacterium sp. TaxID=1914977 RepID=UPI003750EE09
MGITRRNRPIIMSDIVCRMGARSLTPALLLAELHNDYPFLAASTLRGMLDTLESQRTICIAGYEKRGRKPVRIYKVRDKPPPPPKQTWITPLFISITPL